MPRLSNKLCSKAGCHKVISGDKGYCLTHTPKAFEGRRDTGNDSFYKSYGWQKWRKNYLNAHPLCVECIKQNRTVIATIVDHVVSINNGGNKWNWSNLQGLCVSHHNSKTATENNLNRNPSRKSTG